VSILFIIDIIIVKFCYLLIDVIYNICCNNCFVIVSSLLLIQSNSY
jgi:hypothetical protein